MRLLILALLGICCLTACVVEGKSGGSRHAGSGVHALVLTFPKVSLRLPICKMGMIILTLGDLVDP